MRTIGIIPGSFNPPHLGHTLLAKRYAEEYCFDEIRFVPAYQNPLKQPYELSFDQRCELLEIHLNSDETWGDLKRSIKHISVWNIEKEVHRTTRGLVVYFIDTIQAIHDYYGEDEEDTIITLLFGEDILSEFHKWKNFEGISNYCDISFSKRYSNNNTVITSSDIRKAIKDGKKPNGLVTEVYEKIKEWGVYV